MLLLSGHAFKKQIRGKLPENPGTKIYGSARLSPEFIEGRLLTIESSRTTLSK